jgi:beta-glucanase (GH16 family)
MTFNIVRDSKWTELSNQFNIFIGDVRGHSKDNASCKVNTSSFGYDDYAISIGNGNVYIDGGSPYALAMGISEFSKMYQSAASGTNLTGVHYGKYSEKIGSYPTDSYYRPTFIEDFDGSEINTDIWKVFNGSAIEARGFYDENGTYHSKEDNTWQSVRSAEHTYIEDGKLVIEAAYSKDKQLFYGGMLRSHGKMEYRYGYLEVSCIIPNGGGLWTATWLTPTTSDGLYYGEIDVNESYGDAKIAQCNIHLWPTSAGKLWGSPKTSSGYETKLSSGTFNDKFHTYGFLWTEDSLIATIDGEIKGNYKFNDKNVSERYDSLSDYMSLIVSMTVGNPGVDVSKNLDESGEYWNTSNKYIVDYVHIYQIDGQDIRFTPPVSE